MIMLCVYMMYLYLSISHVIGPPTIITEPPEALSLSLSVSQRSKIKHTHTPSDPKGEEHEINKLQRLLLILL